MTQDKSYVSPDHTTPGFARQDTTAHIPTTSKNTAIYVGRRLQQWCQASGRPHKMHCAAKISTMHRLEVSTLSTIYTLSGFATQTQRWSSCCDSNTNCYIKAKDWTLAKSAREVKRRTRDWMHCGGEEPTCSKLHKSKFLLVVDVDVDNTRPCIQLLHITVLSLVHCSSEQRCSSPRSDPRGGGFMVGR